MNGEIIADVAIFKHIADINFLHLALLIVFAIVLIYVVQRLLPRIAEAVPSRFRLPVLSLIPVLRLIILLVWISLLVPMVIEPTVQNFVAFLGAAGLAIGFALKDYLSSLIAGIVTVYERPYRLGDWVKIEGVYGEVKSVGLRSLRVLTLDDTLVTIPHTKFWTTSIHNASEGQRDLLCIADYYLYPRHDGTMVRQKLLDVALTSPYLQLNRPIAVDVVEKPWGTHYRLKAYPIDGRNQSEFVSDLTIRGKATLLEIGARPALLEPGPEDG